MTIAMLVLSGLSAACCGFICVFLHFSAWYPPHIVGVYSNIILGIPFLYIMYISRKWRRMTGKELLNSAAAASPQWLRIVFALLSYIGLFCFFLYLYKCYKVALEPGSTIPAVRNLFYRGYFALIMVLFAMLFSMLYSYRKLATLQKGARGSGDVEEAP
jgi:hypothetical protein